MSMVGKYVALMLRSTQGELDCGEDIIHGPFLTKRAALAFIREECSDLAVEDPNEADSGLFFSDWLVLEVVDHVTPKATVAVSVKLQHRKNKTDE